MSKDSILVENEWKRCIRSDWKYWSLFCILSSSSINTHLPVHHISTNLFLSTWWLIFNYQIGIERTDVWLTRISFDFLDGKKERKTACGNYWRIEWAVTIISTCEISFSFVSFLLSSSKEKGRDTLFMHLYMYIIILWHAWETSNFRMSTPISSGPAGKISRIQKDERHLLSELREIYS